jgi:hypothetical protein
MCTAEARSGIAPVPVRLARWIAVAFLSGAAMMTLQVALNRVAAFAFGSSPFTFSMVVATFVACLALGSFAVSALPRVPAALLPASQWALAAYLVSSCSTRRCPTRPTGRTSCAASSATIPRRSIRSGSRCSCWARACW